MKVPEVKGYGDLEVEPFEEYYARWPAILSNFPTCVIQNWVHRHWQDFHDLWLDRGIEHFIFQQNVFTSPQIMQIGHVGNWLDTMDYWGDELFRNRQRQDTWLAKYMLTHGTSPAPIIVAKDTHDQEHPRGGAMHPLQLIEGHMRLSYLRGMIRHNHPALQGRHSVWLLNFPKTGEVDG